MTYIEILNISMGRENILQFDGDQHCSPEYFHRIGKYSAENQFTAQRMAKHTLTTSSCCLDFSTSERIGEKLNSFQSLTKVAISKDNY